MNRERPHVAYVSYTGLCEPLGASQVLPYIRELSRWYRFSVISFEKPGHHVARSNDDVARELEEHGNSWIRLRYHRRLGLIAKLWDMATGVRALRALHHSDPVALVHARGYVPAQIAVSAGAGRLFPYLFDIRGLQAEESVDAGTWKNYGVRYQLTKASERRLLRVASGIVTLTEAVRPILENHPSIRSRSIPWQVIPCCVDLELFRFREESRTEVRKALKFTDEDVVFLYSGSIGTWYAAEESFRLVAQHPRGQLLVLTTMSPGDVRTLCTRAGLQLDRVRIRAALRRDMPDYLSAADVALCLIRPTPSKRASSPTKVAEALACGLPVLCYPGIGDLDFHASHCPAIVIIDPRQPATGQLPAPVRQSARTHAETYFALAEGARRYRLLYESIRA